MACRPLRYVDSCHRLFSWICRTDLSTSIQRDQILLHNTRLADRAFLGEGSHFEPSVDTGPAKQVPTKRDDRILGELQANITIEASTCSSIIGSSLRGLSELLIWAAFVLLMLIVCLVVAGCTWLCLHTSIFGLQGERLRNHERETDARKRWDVSEGRTGQRMKWAGAGMARRWAFL